MIKKIISLLTILFLLMTLVQCSDFLTGENLDTDPNRATEVPADNLFVGMQVNMFGVMTGPLTFIPAMFMQQMSGVSQHYSGYELYEMTGQQFDSQWFDLYGGGGVADMKIIIEMAEADGKRTLAGITKMWMAIGLATAADLWGAVPYTQAANPEFPTPVYDSQSSVAGAMLNLIDEAIADLQAGQAFFDGSFDFVFGGDTEKWIRAAHTLKARILLNWAETNPGNYALALAEAQQGITSEANNWRAQHSETSGEENLWWQFETRRFGYIRVGAYIVDLMKADNDPRLQVYFTTDLDGNYTGSYPGENNGSASFLGDNSFGAKDWDSEIVTWAETQFIIAECMYAANDAAGAIGVLNDVIQPGLEAKWGLAANSLPRYDTGLTGPLALQAIMQEKYKAMFLNVQVFSDWKRTAFPIFPSTPLDRRIPRRLLYSADELNTNRENVQFLGFYTRTENDPGNPDYPGLPVNQ